jgi:hypothetical protein
MIVQVIPTQLMLELIDSGILVDQQEFNARHFSEVMQMVSGHRVTETGVM